MFSKGYEVKNIHPKNMLITTNSSFFLDKNKIIISGNGTEVIYITGFDETTKIDKVNITMSTSRADLVNNDICNK